MLQLRIHLKLCNACQNYYSQSNWVEGFLKHTLLLNETKLEHAANDGLKDRIKNKIENNS
jgi:Fe-S cluster biosynthesis and repair protein YggX